MIKWGIKGRSLSIVKKMTSCFNQLVSDLINTNSKFLMSLLLFKQKNCFINPLSFLSFLNQTTNHKLNKNIKFRHIYKEKKKYYQEK